MLANWILAQKSHCSMKIFIIYQTVLIARISWPHIVWHISIFWILLCKDKLNFLNFTEMKGYYKVVRYSIVIFVHLLIYYSAEYSVFDEIPFWSITNPIVPMLTQQCWIFLHGFTDSETCHINYSKTRILSNDLRAVDQPRKKLLNWEVDWPSQLNLFQTLSIGICDLWPLDILFWFFNFSSWISHKRC